MPQTEEQARPNIANKCSQQTIVGAHNVCKQKSVGAQMSCKQGNCRRAQMLPRRKGCRQKYCFNRRFVGARKILQTGKLSAQTNLANRKNVVANKCCPQKRCRRKWHFASKKKRGTNKILQTDMLSGQVLRTEHLSGQCLKKKKYTGKL